MPRQKNDLNQTNIWGFRLFNDASIHLPVQTTNEKTRPFRGHIKRVKKGVRTNIIEGYLELAEHHLNYAKPLKSAEKGHNSGSSSNYFSNQRVIQECSPSIRFSTSSAPLKGWDELVMVVTATERTRSDPK